MTLGRGPSENRFPPSIDVLFRSAAVSHRERVIGIVLSGLLNDGTTGMNAIKKCGGYCIVQDPNEVPNSRSVGDSISSHPENKFPKWA